ncbi:hypothetical protein HII31_01175, partial [Pseudocercospora fuligena]
VIGAFKMSRDLACILSAQVQSTDIKVPRKDFERSREILGSAMAEDSFELYDLKVEVVCPPGEKIYCGAKEGDHFILRGEMLHLPQGQGFSIYSLSAVLPLLAAKQRPTHANDWMSTDALVACPDPNCKSQLKITQIGRREFSHAETTAVPLDGNHAS